MRKNTEATAKMEKMTDAELSKKLGNYQAMESIGMLAGIVCIVVDCILAFIIHNLIVFSILFFVGVGFFLLMALPAQKKKKSLIKQQLGDFFQTEFLKEFGPEPKTPELPIDKAYLKNAGLLSLPWEECIISDFHEGTYKGAKFSAANVEQRHTVEEKSGPNNDNWMTRTETVFRGIVIRCRNVCPSDADITVNDRMEKRASGEISDTAAFKKHFEAHTADGKEANEAVTEELILLMQDFEKLVGGKVRGISLFSGDLALAAETRYGFANIPDSLDARDIEGMRKWYTGTLKDMGKLLNILLESPALSAPAAKEK